MAEADPRDAANATPFLSVIVPVYNAATYLPECLSSLQAQTFDDFEVILVDDGSQDTSGSLCDATALEDARFSVIHKTNEGLVRARQTGLEKARGAYVGFVDSDDWVDRDMFEQLCVAVRTQRADIGIAGVMVEHADRTEELLNAVKPGTYDRARLRAEVFPRLVCTGRYFEFGILPTVCTKIFRRGLITMCLAKVPPYIRIGEDAACTYPCMLNAESVVVLPSAPYHYRQHPESMMRESQKGDVGSAIELHALLQRATQRGQHDELESQLAVFHVHLLWEFTRKTFRGASVHRLRDQWLAARLLTTNAESIRAASAVKNFRLPAEVARFARLLTFGNATVLAVGLWQGRLVGALQRTVRRFRSRRS